MKRRSITESRRSGTGQDCGPGFGKLGTSFLHQFASVFALSGVFRCGIAAKHGFRNAVSISNLTRYGIFQP
jgi:hypothetical protein